MDGIFYKDGVYVHFKDDTIEDKTENDFCILADDKKPTNTLYGGRVKVEYCTRGETKLNVDGISVMTIKNYLKTTDTLSFSEAVLHLNAIETNGVDAFLENYKKSIEFLYGELKEMNQKTESQLSMAKEDPKIAGLLYELTQIRNLLLSVLAILFSLNNYMSAGLENEKVISVYQSIIDSFAEYD